MSKSLKNYEFVFLHHQAMSQMNAHDLNPLLKI